MRLDRQVVGTWRGGGTGGVGVLRPSDLGQGAHANAPGASVQPPSGPGHRLSASGLTQSAVDAEPAPRAQPLARHSAQRDGLPGQSSSPARSSRGRFVPFLQRVPSARTQAHRFNRGVAACAWRRGIQMLRHARPGRAASMLLSLAVLAFAALAAAPAQAQTETTLVRTSRGELGDFDIGVFFTGESDRAAQSFTTGGAAQGYTLTKILIRLRGLSSTLTTNSVVKIRQNSRDGTVVATLSNPSSFAASAVNTFTAPANTALARNTTYWVTVNDDAGGNGVSIMAATSESSGLRGWSMGVAYDRAMGQANWLVFGEGSRRMVMEVRGTVTGGNSDTTLKKLGLTAGGSAVSLTPAFHKNTLRYTALVAQGVSSVTVTAEATESRARVEINADDGGTKTLPVRLGRSEIQVTVESSDEAHKAFYRVTVGRGSSDATLASLGVSDGSNAVSLTPAFASDTTDYRARVAESVSSVTVAGTQSDNDARVRIVGDGTDTTARTATLGLERGANSFKVIVVAQNGSTFKTYEVQVIREGPPPHLESATVWGDELNLGYSTHLRPEGRDNLLAPPASAYTVMVEGAPVSVTGTAINSKFVVLTLARPVTHREHGVTVSYTPPPLPDNAVQTTLGGRAAALTDRAVNVLTPQSGPGTGGVQGKQLLYAKMTVGDDRGNERAGYSTSLGIGSFSVVPPAFDFGGDTYTISQLVVSDTEGLHLLLADALTQDAAANLALYVGGTRFRFDGTDRFVGSINSREWFATGLSWADGQIIPVLITDENRPPVFNLKDAGGGKRFMSQGVSGAKKLQTPVTATDPDGHTVTYALEGPDAEQFDIDAATGQLSTREDVIYGNDSGVPYRVTVRASDRFGASRTLDITIVNRFDPGGSDPPLNPGAHAGEPFVLFWYSTFEAEERSGREGLYDNRDFTHGGVEYEVEELTVNSSGSLVLKVDRALPGGLDLSLYNRARYRGWSFSTADAVATNSGKTLTWNNTGVVMSADVNALIQVDLTSFRPTSVVPPTIAAVEGVEGDDQVLDVSWEAPVNLRSGYGNRGWRNVHNLVGYEVRAENRRQTDGQIRRVIADARARSARVSGMTQNAAYDVRVRPLFAKCAACADNREGAWSATITKRPGQFRTEPRAATVPSDGRSVVLTFDDALARNRLPDRNAFTVRVDGTAATLGSSLRKGAHENQIEVPLASAVTRGQAVTVSYERPTSGNVLEDRDGNAAADFTGFVVTNNSNQGPTQGAPPDPLTAEFRDVSVESHDGSTAFTLELGFSEEFPVSAETLRDSALEVTGGAVTAVERTVEGQDQRWRITVTPSTQGTVTIALAPKERCEDEGAICAEDGRSIAEAIEIDIEGPATATTRVTSASITSEPRSNGTWHTGEVVTARVVFSAQVTVNGPPGVGPTLAILLDGTRREAAYTGGSGTDTLTFSYTVTAADDGARNARVAPNGLALNGVVIGDTRGLEVKIGFSVAPRVMAVELVPDASGDRTWTTGETLEVRLIFSEAVTVAGGTPTVGVTLAGAAATLDYASGSGSAVLSFSRTVTVADGTLSEIAVTANSLALAGATLVSEASGLAAELAHDGTAATQPPTSEGRVAEPLTAEFLDVPESHDGSSAFTVTLEFSEPLAAGFSYKTFAGTAGNPSVLQVANGRVTGARRLLQGEDRNKRWQITVEPTGDGTISITLPVTPDCAADNAVCAGINRPVVAAVTATVEGPEPTPPDAPFSVRFEDVPVAHDGESAVVFQVHFSKNPSPYGYNTLRTKTLNIRQGTTTVIPTSVSRLEQGSNQGWQVTVEPGSRADMSITIAPTTDCSAEGAVCTGSTPPEMLSIGAAVVVSGPPGLSVADARVEEEAGAVLAFAVTLDRAASDTVTVDYATSDGTATAGSDYTSTSGNLTFAPGETSKTISVPVDDDSHDEGEETFTLTLSNPSGNNSWLTDAQATGTIENTDPLPRALLARFGRATALHVMEQVEARLEAPRDPGFRGRFAGRELRRGMERDMGRNFLSRLQSTAVAGARDTTGVHSELSPAEFLRTGVGGGDVLMGSAFVVNRQTGGGGSVSLWSRGMESRFSGRDGELSLDGGVRTTMFGADYAKGPLMAGLMLSHRRGLGGYQGAAVGEVASSVTGLHPWVGYKLTERVTLWGVTGYGRGSLSLTPGEALSRPTSLAAPVALEGGLSMSMLAGGVRGDLVDSGVGGFGLAFKADALWVGTGSEAVDGPAGRLAGTEAVVTRVRTALEASRGYVFGHGIALRPSFEVGLRRDGGDAETGAGADVAGSLIVSDPLTGLSVDVRVRTLLVHQDEGFRERGVSVSFSYDPTPSTPLGFTARVAPSWGGQAMSGADALWGRDTMQGLGAAGPGSGDRLDAELGYALPVGSRLVGTPRFGVTTSEYGRGYRLGYSLAVVQGGAMSFQFGLDAQRRESLLQEKPDHSLVGRLTVGW